MANQANNDMELKNLNQSQLVTLFAALLDNDIDTIAQHLDDGGDVTTKDAFGSTLLHMAAAYASVEIVTAVVRHAPVIDCLDNDGRTPLIYACWTGRLDNAQTLAAFGANLNITSRSSSPLHEAAWWGHTDVVCWLINYRASNNPNEPVVDIDARTPFWRQTALHKAASQGNASIVDVLLAAGARAKARDSNWKTPLDLAANDRVRQQLQHAKSNIGYRIMSRLARLRHK